MRNRVCLLLLIVALGSGCQRGADPATGGSATAPPMGAAPVPAGQDSERTWVGLLPCSDCQGIDTRLVLRTRAGRRDYLLTETYLGGPGANSFNRAGAWIEVDALIDGQSLTTYILDPDQGGQRFVLQADGALELLEGNGRRPTQAINYRLQRL